MLITSVRVSTFMCLYIKINCTLSDEVTVDHTKKIISVTQGHKGIKISYSRFCNIILYNIDYMIDYLLFKMNINVYFLFLFIYNKFIL